MLYSNGSSGQGFIYRCDFCDKAATLYFVTIPSSYKEFHVCKKCVSNAFTAFMDAYNKTLKEPPSCVSGGGV